MDEQTVETQLETADTPVDTTATDSNPWENINWELPEPDEPQDVAVSAEESVPVPEVEAESPNPSEAETPVVEEDDEPIEQVLDNYDPDKPIPLSRKQKLELGKSLIEPFRDPTTPIEDVYKSLYEFHPTRTQELAQALVENSLQAAPDAWLQHLTGLDVTVDGIKQLIAQQGSGQPSNTDELSDAISLLDRTYGEDWRNPANDTGLLEEDLPLVRAIRSQLDAKDAKDEQIRALEEKLKSLEPEIDSIKQQKEAEFAAKQQEIFVNDVNSLRNRIETNAIPTVLDKLNLKPTENDSEDVKAVKNLVANAFKGVGEYGSQFDTFLETSYTKREDVAKSMTRIGQAFTEAAKLEAQALRNPSQANELKAQANALRNQVSREQDALAVRAQQAADEFIKTQYAPILRLIEENAALKLQRGSRTEVIGNTAANGGKTFGERAQEIRQSGGNPFDAVAERFAQFGR